MEAVDSVFRDLLQHRVRQLVRTKVDRHVRPRCIRRTKKRARRGSRVLTREANRNRDFTFEFQARGSLRVHRADLLAERQNRNHDFKTLLGSKVPAACPLRLSREQRKSALADGPTGSEDGAPFRPDATQGAHVACEVAVRVPAIVVLQGNDERAVAQGRMADSTNRQARCVLPARARPTRGRRRRRSRG